LTDIDTHTVYVCEFDLLIS